MSWKESIPSPAEKRIAVHVNVAAERVLRKGHPWLFEGAINRQSHEGRPGDLAVVFDRKDRFLAVGLYDPRSPIRIRILQHNKPARIDGAWFETKLAGAAALRQPLLEDERTTAYRLVHGENDGLPGLVVDRYADTYVVSLDTAAWVPYLPELLPILKKLTGAARFILRLSRSVQERADDLYGLKEGQVLAGPAGSQVEFLENGLRFAADLVQGQKTGFFLDQRENRARVESLVAGDKGIQRVLNVFAYTGAFSLYAARGGASVVTSVELSRPALEAAEANFALNRHVKSVAQARHETMAGDAFEVLDLLGQAEHLFDMVVIDPPSFARRQTEVEGGLWAYGQLTRLGLAVLRPGGMLVFSSCSSRITAESFFDVVFQAAQREGSVLHEIGRSGHPLDHPVGFPEGAYLKCLFAVSG